MENYYNIQFPYGAMIECGNVAIDNVFSIDIVIEDDYMNMDLNDHNNFVIGTIVQCGSDDIIDVDAVKYQYDGCINENGETTPIVKNGKVIYK